MKKNIVRLLSILLTMVFILSAASIANAEGGTESAPLPGGNMVAVGCRVLKGGAPTAKVEKGDTVSVELTVKNTALKTSEVDPAVPIDLTRVMDSFSTGAQPTVQVVSAGEAALEMVLTFPDCVYSGTGKLFRFMVGCRKLGDTADAYEQGEITMQECVEYVAPEPTPAPSPTPEPTPAAVPAPSLRISRSDVPTLKAGNEAVVVLSFTNVGSVQMENMLATVSTSDALLLMENASSFPIGNLPAGHTANISLRFKLAKTVSAEQQTINVDAKFNYFNGEGRVQGTASDKLNLLAKATAADGVRPDGPQPNIILQKYTFGDGSGQAAAGSEFDLSLDFINTSTKRKVENVVMTVEPGEGLSISNSSNTFYYDAMGKEEAKSEKVKLLALSSAKPGVAEVTLTFKYEYVDNNKRLPVSVAQKLSIQLFQPDRFEVTLNALPESVTAGEETSVSLNYMNKGKSDVSNVQAKLEGSVTALGSIQNIGNLEPGRSGSINFIITPDEAGTVECRIAVTYEDVSGKIKTIDIPVSLTVAEPVSDPISDEELGEMQEPEKKGGILWYILGGVALCGAGAAVLIVIKRGKKKPARKSGFEWKDDTEV